MTKKKVQKLEEKIKELNAKIAIFENGWKRTQADFENYRKRNEEQGLELIMLAKADFMTKITPVLDNFRRAFTHAPHHKTDSEWVSGIKQIEKQLSELLSQEGLNETPAHPGQKFDPNLHEAISYEPNDHPEDSIIEVIESGWMFDNRVLKPAKVRVSKGK